MKTPLFTLNTEDLVDKLEFLVVDAFNTKTEIDTISKRLNHMLEVIARECDVVRGVALLRALVECDFASDEAKSLFLIAFDNAIKNTDIITDQNGNILTYPTLKLVLSNISNVEIPRVLRNEYPVIAMLSDFAS